MERSRWITNIRDDPTLIKDLPSIYYHDEEMLNWILMAMTIYYCLLPEHVQLNEKRLIRVLSIWPHRLEHLSDKIKDTKQYVFEAVKKNGYCLQFASKNLREDAEFVASLVIFKGYCLKYASDAIRSNLEIIDLALRNNPSAFAYISEELRNNEQYFRKMLLKYPEILECAPQKFKEYFSHRSLLARDCEREIPEIKKRKMENESGHCKLDEKPENTTVISTEKKPE